MSHPLVIGKYEAVIHDLVKVRPKMFFVVLAILLTKVFDQCIKNLTTANKALKTILLIDDRNVTVTVAVQNRRDGKHISLRRNGDRMTLHNGRNSCGLTGKASKHLIGKIG